MSPIEQENSFLKRLLLVIFKRILEKRVSFIWNQYTKKRAVLQDYPCKNCCCIVSGNFEGIPQTGEAAGIFHRKNFCEWNYHSISVNEKQ